MTRFANSGSVQDFLVSTENYGDIAAQAVHDFHMQNLTSMQADGLIAKTHIEAGEIEDLGKINAKRIRAGGSAAGDAAMWGGVRQGAQGLFGGFASKFGSPTIYEGTQQAAQNVSQGYSPGLGIPLDAYFGPGSYSGRS